MAGSEEKFARRLNQVSKELGLTFSSWRNDRGLTASGHMASAKDLARLMLAHNRNFSEYFNMFGRRTTDVGLKVTTSSSRRILANIEGVEAARFGHARAAGYSGVLYVTRNDKSVVVVMLGARSTRGLLDRLVELTDAILKYLELACYKPNRGSYMEITGKIVECLPLKSGQSANSEWRKQEYVLEKDGQYHLRLSEH